MFYKRYSGSDLKFLCREAALFPLRENTQDIKTIRVEDIRPLLTKDFSDAMLHIKPSVSNVAINKYETWNNEYGLKG